MDRVFVFKVMDKGRKSKWKLIEILGSQTFAMLDRTIRKAFNFDLYDHLSEFYRENVFSPSGFGEIEPGGVGRGAKIKIEQLGLRIDETLEYIYDFGSSAIKTVTLLEIKDTTPSSIYPQITMESKPRNTYCKSCREGGIKKKAEYFVMFKESRKSEKLCKDCVKWISKNKAYINRFIN